MIINARIVYYAVIQAMLFRCIESWAPNGARKSFSKVQMTVSSSRIVEEVSSQLSSSGAFLAIDKHTKYNLERILALYKEERLDAPDFQGVNGYGYGDLGREKLDRIVAALMGAESAIVRLQFFSGTHAISSALFACVRPGDTILGVSGKPYDTLEEVLGLRANAQTGTTSGSLADWGIAYSEVPLCEAESYADNDEASTHMHPATFDLAAIDAAIKADPSIKVSRAPALVLALTSAC
jgi:cystathionine beta-lyase family protein involved in aluminum resistance